MVIQLCEYGNHSHDSATLILVRSGAVEPVTSIIHGPCHRGESGSVSIMQKSWAGQPPTCHRSNGTSNTPPSLGESVVA